MSTKNVIRNKVNLISESLTKTDKKEPVKIVAPIVESSERKNSRLKNLMK